MAQCLNLSTYVLLIIPLTSCDMDVLKNPDACASELPFCKLDLGKYANKQGLPGAKGPKGDMGMPGVHGFPGSDGSDGSDGKNGGIGAPGNQGPVGPPGDLGFKGEKGNMGGDDGSAKVPLNGNPGLRGIQGLPGETGDKGPPGANATCGCKNEASDSFEPEGDASGMDWGTEQIANVTCRNAPDSMEFEEDKIYYLYLTIGVTCDPMTKQTCIAPYASTKNVTDFKYSKPFWISEKNVSLKDIYNLKFDQLSWLQSESLSAEMTIKYHCYNSNPLGKDPMMLLTWNGVRIGPEATSSSPFHYITEDNGCSEAKDKWSSTVIKLESPTDGRLPIIDFFINDIRNEDQSFRIEIMSLCFY